MTLNSVKQDRSSPRTPNRLVALSGSGRTGLGGRAACLYWSMVGVAEALMAMRLAGKLVSEAPANDFMRFVYQVTDVVLAPFHGFWPTPPPAGGVVEVPTMVAMCLYVVLAWTAMDSVVALLGRPRAARTAWLGRRLDAARVHRQAPERS